MDKREYDGFNAINGNFFIHIFDSIISIGRSIYQFNIWFQ